MKLVWKNYLLLLGFLALSLALLTAGIGFWQAGQSLENIREEQRLFATTAATQVETGYHDQVWPFEMLAGISRDSDFVYWRVVDGNGRIVLSHPTTRGPAEVSVPVPQEVFSDPLRVLGEQPDTEVWIVPMRMRTAGRPWTFWLGFSLRPVIRQTHEFVWVSASFGLAVAIVLVPISWLVTRRLLRPVANLSRAAAQMAAGDLRISLPHAGHDEIGRLVDSFQTMADHILARDAEIQAQMVALQKARDELEHRVAERTSELTFANAYLKDEIAEREQAEKALRDSQERFGQVAENAGEWIWETDAAGLYTYSSLAVERILGYRPEELVGRMHFYDLFAPESREEIKAAARKSIAEGMPFRRFVNAHTSRDGRTVILETSGLPLRDEDGRIVGYRGVDTDITERKRMEESLRASEERFRLVAEQTGQVVYDWDIATGRIRWAGAIAAALGYAPDEFQKINIDQWLSMIHPQDRSNVAAELAERQSRGEPFLVQYRFPRRDGSHLDVEDAGVFLPGADGKPYRMLGVMKDITERKQAEESLRQSEQWLKSVLDNVQTGILVIDCETHEIADANTVALRLLGRPKEEVVGRICNKFVCPAEAGKCPISDLGQKVDHSERILLTADGKKCPIIKTVTRVEMSGRPYLLESFTDISERKRLEDELRQSHDLLEQRVEDRTTKLVQANEQLRQTQMELVQSEKMGMLGQLVAGVAHEINTPTGAILNVMGDVSQHIRGLMETQESQRAMPPETARWLTEACGRLLDRCRVLGDVEERTLRRQIERELERQGHDDARRLAVIIARCFGPEWRDAPALLDHLAVDPVPTVLEHLSGLQASTEISLASAQKIARIVRALRYYSHVGQDEQTDVNVNESIDNVLVILRNRLKNLAEVRTAFAANLPLVRCGAEISQVWTNILANACDVMEENKGPKLGVIAITTRAAEKQVVVEIYNDGPSIPKEVLQKVFDPFFTTKPVGKGTGLGLGICVGILRRCQGTVSVRNESAGVTFTVCLPAANRANGGSEAALKGDKPLASLEEGSR